MALGFRLRDRLVSLDELVLDANNYRLTFENDGNKYSDKEAESEKVQEETQKKLVKEKLSELKDSIQENGFLEVDRIVVRKSEFSEKYIVIEGNRRTAAFKALIKDNKKPGVDLKKEILQKSRGINVVEIIGSKEEINNYAATLMGIRHVSGPKKWPGIQSARLIYDLKISGKSTKQIGALLGISSVDANRRLRGFLAYKQMREDKKYNALVKTNHYTLLLEFLPMKNSTGKDWLEWSERDLKFKNEDNRNRLFTALTKPLSDGKPEINNPDNARMFLKALSIEHLRVKIENGTKLFDLGPIIDEKSVVKEIKDFEKFLSRFDDQDVSTEVIDSLNVIYKKIEKVLG